MIQSNKIKILLVDDDPSFRKIIRQVALNSSVSVTAVEDMKKYQSEKSLSEFDLVLLDYDLEDTTGFMEAEDLMELVPELPIVMTSSTGRPWQDRKRELPNILNFVNKWNKPKDILKQVVAAYRFKDRSDRGTYKKVCVEKQLKKEVKIFDENVTNKVTKQRGGRSENSRFVPQGGYLRVQ